MLLKCCFIQEFAMFVALKMFAILASETFALIKIAEEICVVTTRW